MKRNVVELREPRQSRVLDRREKPAGRARKIAIIIFAMCTFTMNAQDISFHLISGIGAALSYGEMPAYGISASVEPKVFIGNNIAAGLRFEGDVLLGGNIDTENTENLSVGMSSRAAQLVKGEYYITDMKVRPYVGFGLGRFTQANIGATGAGEVSIDAYNGFGVAPEVGIALGSFRLSAIYNVVPGKSLVNITVGDVREVSRNYLVLQMSWKWFKIGF